MFIVTVGVGIQDRPASAPQEGPWESDFRISNTPSFAQAASAISTFVFAYAGTPAFFPIVSEMRDPRLYARALLVCQSGITVAYVTIGCVVYYYCGSYVASPTLGSAGALLKKVCYGIALPGLLIGATLSLHVSSTSRMIVPGRTEYDHSQTRSCLVISQVYLCSRPARFRPPYFQFGNPLGSMAVLHRRPWASRVHHRQCRSQIRQSCVACRSLVYYAMHLPVDGVYVVVRQLGGGKEKPDEKLAFHGLLVCFYRDDWRVFDHLGDV